MSCLKYSVLPYVLMSSNQFQFKNSSFEDTKITAEIRTKAGLESGGVLSYFFFRSLLRYTPARQRRLENRTPL